MSAMLRKKSVAARLDVSPRTVWRWSTDPAYAALGFPRPVEVGPGCTAWLADEIDEWVAQRFAARQALPAIDGGE
jgi:prophage regulatory protein